MTDGRTTDGRQLDGYTISSPCETNGSGELKMIFWALCKVIMDFALHTLHNQHRSISDHIWGPRGLGIWGEGLFIFRELGSPANYFKGAGEQAHTFGDFGSTAKM